jgi:hypothetical protein
MAFLNTVPPSYQDSGRFSFFGGHLVYKTSQPQKFSNVVLKLHNKYWENLNAPNTQFEIQN